MTLRSASLVAAVAALAIGPAGWAAEPEASRTAPSADGATVHQTLADAVARALGENAAAQLATSEIARAETVAAQARAALLPQVSGSAVESNQTINFETF